MDVIPTNPKTLNIAINRAHLNQNQSVPISTIFTTKPSTVKKQGKELYKTINPINQDPPLITREYKQKNTIRNLMPSISSLDQQ